MAGTPHPCVCSSGLREEYMGFFCLHLKFIGGLVTFSKEAIALILLCRTRINIMTDWKDEEMYSPFNNVPTALSSYCESF